MVRLVSYALLWAAAAQAGDLMDPFAGLPEVIEAVPIAGELSSMGVPVLAKTVRTRLKPEQAQRWVAASFRKADLYIPKPEAQFQLQGAPQLTGYDPKARRSYTAIFKQNADGTTTVVMGTADVSQSQGSKRPALSLPVFPGAAQAVEAQQEGGSSLSYVATATQAELESFYGEVLGPAGWTRDESLQGWVRGGQLLTVSQSPRSDGKQSVSVLVRSGGVGK